MKLNKLVASIETINKSLPVCLSFLTVNQTVRRICHNKGCFDQPNSETLRCLFSLKTSIFRSTNDYLIVQSHSSWHLTRISVRSFLVDRAINKVLRVCCGRSKSTRHGLFLIALVSDSRIPQVSSYAIWNISSRFVCTYTTWYFVQISISFVLNPPIYFAFRSGNQRWPKKTRSRRFERDDRVSETYHPIYVGPNSSWKWYAMKFYL